MAAEPGVQVPTRVPIERLHEHLQKRKLCIGSMASLAPRGMVFVSVELPVVVNAPVVNQLLALINAAVSMEPRVRVVFPDIQTTHIATPIGAGFLHIQTYDVGRVRMLMPTRWFGGGLQCTKLSLSAAQQIIREQELPNGR